MSVDQIEREVRIAAPVERVWALVTEAEHLGTWFGDAGAEVDLRPGGELLLRWARAGGGAVTAKARIEQVEPPRRLSYRWVPGEAGGELVDGHTTLVELTLREDGDGTLLKVVESGFASLTFPDDDRERRRADNTGGWAAELDELVRYALEPAAR